MKVTFEFDTSNEDDEMNTVKMYLHAPDMFSALYEADNRLRSFYKYNDYDDEVGRLIEEVREILRGCEIEF